MAISVYTLEQSQEWDRLVKTFKEYDVYYLSGYAKAFQINGDGEALLIYFEKDSTKAINVILKRNLSSEECLKECTDSVHFFDAITPYGYGGFLVEGNEISELQKEYEHFCKENNIICEFVRFHPMIRNWESIGDMYQVHSLGDTVYMDTTNEETIWANISSKNRNVIRKAKKSGIEIYWGRDPRIIKPFMEIYNETMDRDQADSYYYFPKEFYESILWDLKQNAMWFYAMYGGEIIAISIFLFENERMHYHLSASKREYQRLAPTNLLLHEAAIWAANNGYKSLHMGGGVGSTHDSLYKFKKAFNRGEDSEFCIGKRIFDKERYDYFVEWRKKQDKNFDEQTSFFPKYRGK